MTGRDLQPLWGRAKEVTGVTGGINAKNNHLSHQKHQKKTSKANKSLGRCYLSIEPNSFLQSGYRARFWNKPDQPYQQTLRLSKVSFLGLY
jgi:hypothetical protein